MKKMKKYVNLLAVLLVAFAFLFSFTACSDDDDDDDDAVDDTVTTLELSDKEIVNIVAAGFVDALTTGYDNDEYVAHYYDDDGNEIEYEADDDDDGTAYSYVLSVSSGDYADWVVNNSTYELTLTTTKDYTGSVAAEDEEATEDEAEEAVAYTVYIASGSYVYVPLYAVYVDTSSDMLVKVSLDSSIDGVKEVLYLAAYFGVDDDGNLQPLTSDDNTEDGETDYAPVLTINGNTTDLSEDEIAEIVSGLVIDVMGSLN